LIHEIDIDNININIIYRQYEQPATAGEVAAGGQPDTTAGAGDQWRRWAANSREDVDTPRPSGPQ